jgi:hypothetical protein
MSEQNEAIVPALPSSTEPRSDPLNIVRQLAYAWVGMWSVAGDDLGNFYQRSVARGEQLLKPRTPATRPAATPQEPDVGVNQAKSAASRRIRPTTIMNAFGAVESYHIDLNAEGILPTRQELDALSERVEALSREVDALVDQRKQGQ